MCKLKKLTNARDAVFEIIFLHTSSELVGVFKEASRNFTLRKKPRNVMSQRSGIY
jgi:hypothetical protein